MSVNLLVFIVYSIVILYGSMENSQKKSRAPKATNTQLEFLLAYMEEHNAFATGKLLGARGKAAHDAQWQKLTEKLNSLDGLSKLEDAWKKLWCDQRNQARARAAKAKAQQRLTGNIGKPVQLRDSDLKILAIFGGESSIGLPIMEVSVGARPEDTIESSLILGLKNNTAKEKNGADDVVSREEQAITKENINITDDSIILEDFLHEGFSQSNSDDNLSCTSADVIISSLIDESSTSINQFTEHTTTTPLKTVRKRLTTTLKSDGFNNKHQKNSFSQSNCDNNQSCASADVIISAQYIDKPSTSNQCTEYSTTTPLKTAPKQLTTTLKSDEFNNKRQKNSLEKRIDNFKNTQDKQTETLQAIVEILNRFTSAVEKQNELIERSVSLHERTLKILAATVKDLTAKI